MNRLASVVGIASEQFLPILQNLARGHRPHGDDLHPLSWRQLEDFLAERGIDLCHETIRYWWNRFGSVEGREPDRLPGRCGIRRHGRVIRRPGLPARSRSLSVRPPSSPQGFASSAAGRPDDPPLTAPRGQTPGFHAIINGNRFQVSRRTVPRARFRHSTPARPAWLWAEEPRERIRLKRAALSFLPALDGT